MGEPVFDFVERLGLGHGPQIVSVTVPAHAPELFTLRDEVTGREFLAQRSRARSNQAFVLLDVQPLAHIHLSFDPQANAVTTPSESSVRFDERGDLLELSNGCCALRLTRFPEAVRLSAAEVPAPIRSVRVEQGSWRGNSFFEIAARTATVQTQILECGPLRVEVRFQYSFEGGGVYQCTVRLDALQRHAEIQERSTDCGAADQIVWDFTGDDLPTRFLLLEKERTHRQRTVQCFFDDRVARLARWTQMAQLFDFYEAFAMTCGSGDNPDVLGAVTLQGGSWRGSRLNHLELWARRWIGQDRATRRGVPADAKADASPSPELQPLTRRGSRTTAHVSWEGWIGDVQRNWALVLAPLHAMQTHTVVKHSQHESPTHEPQSLLRQLQMQRGIASLQNVAAMTLDWHDQIAPDRLQTELPAALREWEDAGVPTIWREVRQRVVGYLAGDGPEAANPVNCRCIAPMMRAFRRRQREGMIEPAMDAQLRAHLAFLAHLFSSDDYYPGAASMQRSDDAQSLEPTIAGMANQNFYTDVITLFGTFAQVFASHPLAHAWLEQFRTQWSAQLDHHVYPNSGVWEESHTYCHHVLLTVLPLLVALRDCCCGDADPFADARLQNLSRGLLRQIAPRSAEADGARCMVPLGDHEIDTELYRGIYAVLAQGIEPHDHQLARQLIWAHREMNGREPVRIEPEAPRVQDEHVEGLGYFFRSSGAEAKESLLVLRAGSAWGHHHPDDGSIHLFAHGRYLIGDAGLSGRQPNTIKLAAQGHSRAAPVDVEPLNHLWRFNRGWIAHQGSHGSITHATAYCPILMTMPATPRPRRSPTLLPDPIQQFRTVVRLDADTFLIADASDSRSGTHTWFHVSAEPTLVSSNQISLPMGNDHWLVIQCLTEGLGVTLADHHGSHRKNQSDPTPARWRTWQIHASGKQRISLWLLSITKQPNAGPVQTFRSASSASVTRYELRQSLPVTLDTDRQILSVGSEGYAIPLAPHG